MDKAAKKALAEWSRRFATGKTKVKRLPGRRPKKASIDWVRDVQNVLDQHNRRAADGRGNASHATQQRRASVIFSAYRTLRKLGYKIQSARSLKLRHVFALVDEWKKQGMAPASIQSGLSVLRVYCEWIQKPGMIPASVYFSPDDKAAVTRNSAAQEDKTWSGNGVDVTSKINEVFEYDKRVGLSLMFCYEFGLRRKEAIMLRPHYDDRDTVLVVSRGAKGGRERAVPIDSKSKRAVLDLAKSLVAITESVADPALTLVQASNRISNVVRKFGLSKAMLGVTVHGLRHEAASLKYKRITGEESPVRAGRKPAEQLDLFARASIAQELGHGRVRVTDAYLGRWHPKFEVERIKPAEEEPQS